MKLLIMLFIFFSNGNDTLKLDYCYEQVYAKYPLGAQRELNKSSTELKLDNLDKNYLPQINITGQASYQSDVTEIDVGSPLFTTPKINKDQYKIYLDVKQTVFDGGITSSLKDVERNQLLANNQDIEVELYRLKQRINDLFFSILLLQEKRDLVNVKLNTVKEQLSEIESQIKYGVLPASNRYILEAEILKIDQELFELESNRMASLNMLGELLDEEFDKNTKLELPSPEVTDFDANPGDRLEFKLVQLEKNSLKSSDDV